jgi:phosphoenolpyruvate carboxykinase (ATP)
MRKMKLQVPDLGYLNLGGDITVKYQLSPMELIDEALLNKEGVLSSSGALAVDTGKYTGRSPKDRFIVCDGITENTVWWGDVNIKINPEKFNHLFNKLTAYLSDKKIYVRDSSACADPAHAISIRVIKKQPIKTFLQIISFCVLNSKVWVSSLSGQLSPPLVF